MELLNYKTPKSQQLDVDTHFMKVSASNNVALAATPYNHGSESSCMSNVHLPNAQSYYYSDDLNTYSVTPSNDYVYKESYNYMINPAEGNSIDEFSPTRSPFTLQVVPSHFQSNQSVSHNSQPLSQIVPPNNQLILNQETQPQQQHHEQHHEQQHEQHQLEQQQQLTSQLQQPQLGHPHLSSRFEPQLPVESIEIPSNIDVNQYPDMTTLFNSNSSILLPPVESQFVDHKACSICGKRITRDMSRHMRTHQTESRFTCKFPKSQCRHKTGKFNRPYDFKKHLLNRHFKFDNPCIKRLHNLKDKLEHWGTCPCGVRCKGKYWLEDHILTHDQSKKCCFVD